MVAALICREMKWDWEQYQSQPKWFIDVILSMMQEEAEESKRKDKVMMYLAKMPDMGH